MIKYQCKLLTVVMFVLVSFLSYADASDESIDKLLVLSGLTKQIEQFPGLIKLGLEQAKQQGSPISEEKYNLLVSSANKSILPKNILKGIRVTLKKSINKKEIKQLLAWYESDLGKEITRAEKNASTPEAYNKMMKSAQSLLANSERVELANRLDTLIGSTDMGMRIQRHTGIAVYSGLMTAIQPDKPLNLQPFIEQIEAGKVQTRAAVKQVVAVSYVYSYQNIKMDKMKKYEDFLNKPITKKFYKMVMGSMSKELETSISKWSDKLALIFTIKKPNN